MEASSPQEILRAGALEVRPGDGLAVCDGRPLRLSVRELDVLVALARRPGRVVRREELHGVVWGGRFRKDDRSVDVYVNKLRIKLESALPQWRFIHTHFGLGYRFSAEPSQVLHSATTGRQQQEGLPMAASHPMRYDEKETT
jgi:DNA-binding response OmpR family regulator